MPKISADGRPDPDMLLAEIHADENAKKQGALRVFFGMAPGVGKTCAMLRAAHQLKAEGIDVVVGVIETHGRTETASLINGLEILPPRIEQKNGVTFKEFDLDMALARRPKLLLVDELAHSNSPVIRHPKRYQDVLELLHAGIDVYTTINVQHLESLNDIVSQITGIQVRETVPDAIIEQAAAITLIDLPPEELLKRLNEGKVYGAEQAVRAQKNFFRPGNLMALRELALRKVAAEVDDDMRRYQRTHAVSGTWAAAQRLLVCVGPSPLSGRVVRVASRMAESLHAEWFAVHVEPTGSTLDARSRQRALEHLRLAEQLGAHTQTISGDNPSRAILQHAHTHQVTMIVVGRPMHARWQDWWRGSFVDDLMRGSGAIEMHVVAGDSPANSPARHPQISHHYMPGRQSAAHNFFAPFVEHGGFGWVIGGVAGCTGVAYLLDPYVAHADLAMIYLLGIVALAHRLALGPSLLGVALSVGAFNFFFIDPRYTFAVHDVRYLIVFGVMAVVGGLVSGLAARARRAVRMATEREKRAEVLYELTHGLADARTVEVLAEVAVERLWRLLRVDLCLYLVDAAADEGAEGQNKSQSAFKELKMRARRGDVWGEKAEHITARWAFDHGQASGLGTDNLPGAEGLYIPLVGAQQTWGVLGLRVVEVDLLADPAKRDLLYALVRAIASAVERVWAAEGQHRSEVRLESERLRATLLSSVSHDLRTPLGTVLGAAGALLDPSLVLSEAGRRDLIEGIYAEAERLTRLVQNLLEMTRLSSGAVKLRCAWHVPEEVVGNALRAVGRALGGYTVAVNACDDLALFDALLVERVLVNLIDNAIKYSPAQTVIQVSATRTEDAVQFEVRDQGPGIDPDEVPALFQKFYQGYQSQQQGDQRPGVGLGLAICQAIVNAHGGQIWATNAVPPPGAIFGFRLPSPKSPMVGP
jgi:two-component system sensor histidine kinase KdpD